MTLNLNEVKNWFKKMSDNPSESFTLKIGFSKTIMVYLACVVLLFMIFAYSIVNHLKCTYHVDHIMAHNSSILPEPTRPQPTAIINIHYTEESREEIATFHVLHENKDFAMRHCLEDNSVISYVATHKKSDTTTIDASKLSFAESRNRMAMTSMLSKTKSKYYCFIDGDIVMDCNQFTSFLYKLENSNVSVAQPYYTFWKLPRCNCSYCGLTFSDPSFLCIKREALATYLPFNTYCDEYNWGSHMIFFIQEMIRQREYIYMDPDFEYHNPKHEKVYKEFKLSCVTEYYKLTKRPYNTETIVIPWDVRFKQEINCLNV